METELEPTQHETQEIVTISPTSFYAPDQFPDLDKAAAGVSLTPKYYEFKNAGETVRAVFCGFSSMNSKNKDGQIPLAILQTKDGFFVNAGANLVSQLQKLPPKTAVQITYNGTQKTGGGNNVKTFDVRLLTIGAAHPKTEGNGHTPPAHTTPASTAPVSLKQQWKDVWSAAQHAGVKLAPIGGDITDAALQKRINEARLAISEAAEF